MAERLPRPVIWVSLGYGVGQLGERSGVFRKVVLVGFSTLDSSNMEGSEDTGVRPSEHTASFPQRELAACPFTCRLEVSACLISAAHVTLLVGKPSSYGAELMGLSVRVFVFVFFLTLTLGHAY